MGKPNKLVALCVNISGGCEYVALVKNIDEIEYAELLYEQQYPILFSNPASRDGGAYYEVCGRGVHFGEILC